MRLLCFPYAGASAAIFRSWHSYLPEAVEVCGIQLPGRRNRIMEPPYARMVPLLEELGRALLPLLDRPFAFFGHSMGALLCFETARWLRHNWHPEPKLLFISARCAPHIPDRRPPLHRMNDTEFLEEIKELNGGSEEILRDPQVLPIVLPALRADAELCETYEYVEQLALSCPIIAFCGADDHQASLELMKEWRAQTTKEFFLHTLQGSHFFIHSSEAQLLDLLRRNLLAILNNKGTG